MDPADLNRCDGCMGIMMEFSGSKNAVKQNLNSLFDHGNDLITGHSIQVWVIEIQVHDSAQQAVD